MDLVDSEEDSPKEVRSLSTNDTQQMQFLQKRLQILQEQIQELKIKHRIWMNKTNLYHAKKYAKKHHKKVNLTHVDHLSICSRYKREASEGKVFIPNIWKAHMEYSIDDVTLVSQMSLNKLEAFDRLLHHWTGPVSLALYILVEHMDNAFEQIAKWNLMTTRRNVDLHIVAGFGVSLM